MYMEINSGEKKNVLKKIFFLAIGLGVLGGLFWYVNTYVYKSKASYPLANFTLTAAPATINVEESKDFVVSFNVSGQKVYAIELFLEYDPNLVEYFTEYGQGSGFSEVKAAEAANFFDSPLIETVSAIPGTSKKQLKLSIISKYTDTANPDWKTNVTANLKFRAKNPGTATILVMKGEGFTELAGAYSGSATYFDIPDGNIQAVVQINGPAATATPTTGPGTPTVTSVPPTATPTTGAGTPTVTRAPTAQPTRSNGIENVTLNMKVRFQGVIDKPRDNTNQINVEVALVSNDNSYTKNTTATFVPDGGGLWSGKVNFDAVPLSKDYNIFVKGQKHLRKRICDLSPRETIPGGYRCTQTGGEFTIDRGTITLKGGENNVDFTSIVMLAGDIPEQDGVVDIVDISFIIKNFGNTQSDKRVRGDLNYDGIIDTQDYTLVLTALGFKYDEE